MDQPTVELIVRLTARLSAAMFAAAVVLFAAGYRRDPRRVHVATRLFAGFIVAHTIHFATVVWLAVVSAGANIRERDGWAMAVTVALLFYMAAFVVLRQWRDAAEGRTSSPTPRVTSHAAVVAIAAVFLNSYLSRVERMPAYWLPIVALVGIVTLYVFRTRALPDKARLESEV